MVWLGTWNACLMDVVSVCYMVQSGSGYFCFKVMSYKTEYSTRDRPILFWLIYCVWNLWGFLSCTIRRVKSKTIIREAGLVFSIQHLQEFVLLSPLTIFFTHSLRHSIINSKLLNRWTRYPLLICILYSNNWCNRLTVRGASRE